MFDEVEFWQQQIAQTLVTKQDACETELRLLKEIEVVRKDLALQIEVLRSDVRKDIQLVLESTQKMIAQLRYELIKWMVGIGCAAFLGLAGLLKYMH